MRKLAHWLEEYTPSESIDFMRTLALTHSELGGQIGAEITKLIRSDDLKSLVGFDFSYEDPRFENPEQIRHCRQALAFFSKLENLEIGLDKEEEALRKWIEAEDRCRETNVLFRKRDRGEFQFSSRVEQVFQTARRKIARVLGKVPKFDELQYRFGPGATTATKKKDASTRQKLQAGIQCSEDLFPMAKAILEEVPHLASLHSVLDRIDEEGEEWMSVPVDVTYGRLDFVPKNAKIYRITVIEPLLNSMFQLAIGDFLFRRLAAFGLNLRDQTLNQCYAMVGSLSGDLATLDLKSASDTIALELVYAFLPLEWAVLLRAGRTGKVIAPSGVVINQEKFSSMGNGYTFPLESLIFWAITSACTQKGDIVNVFGDDIVCPTAAVPLVKESLNAFGFWVNELKSYDEGPFRESCGKDFYRGIDVRPYYQKEWVSARTLFLLHNHYARRGDWRCDLILKWIHPDLHLFGPDGYGDGHLLREYIPKRKKSHIARGFAGHLFETFTVKARRDIRPNQKGDFVLPHYSIYRRGVSPLVDFDSIPRPRDASGHWRTWERGTTYQSRCVDEPSTALPLIEGEDGGFVKAVSLPGEDGYKKIAIYTLGG